MTVRSSVKYVIRFDEVEAYHQHKAIYFSADAKKHRVVHQSEGDIDDAIDEKLLIRFEASDARWYPDDEDVAAIHDMLELAEEKGGSRNMVEIMDFFDNVREIRIFEGGENPPSDEIRLINETEFA